MRIIDVTLRDGGHAVDFNWEMSFAKEYYEIVSDMVDYVELGYWMQSEKSINPFYNLDMDKINDITQSSKRRNVSIMIDYHYCVKDVKLYPKYDEQEEVAMIRLCSRKEDIDDAIKFGSELKTYTGLNVSFNIFNASNYSEEEITQNCTKVSTNNFDFIYFADTHGSMDLKRDINKFENGLDILIQSGKSVGIHLHDHLGKAYYNYQFANEYGFDFSDTSVRGMGKGAGNLKLEYLKVDNKLIEFINKHNELLQIHPTPWELITAKHSLTDNYAKEASAINLPIPTFINFCEWINGVDKDSYDNKLMNEFLKK
jgi:4-hydroxy 2-oxovalerate aldolase